MLTFNLENMKIRIFKYYFIQILFKHLQVMQGRDQLKFVKSLCLNISNRNQAKF